MSDNEHRINRFPTVAANWEHFNRVDIAPSAPQIQRDEMQRAFMAGVSSGLVLALAAEQSDDFAAGLARINAELVAWAAMRKAKRS